MKNYSQLVLRVGLALVFFWFSSQQFSNPTMWVKILPDWTSALPISAVTFIHMNAWFELIFGLFLLSGFYTRAVALILGLHLFGITMTIGYNATGVRDFGLAMAAISIFLHGPSAFSLDKYFSSKEQANISTTEVI